MISRTTAKAKSEKVPNVSLPSAIAITAGARILMSQYIVLLKYGKDIAYIDSLRARIFPRKY